MTKLFKDLKGRKKAGRYTPPEVYRRQTKIYPSLGTGKSIALKQDNLEKLEVSAKYTVAPAYNKGAYQVISVDNVKDIGK